MPDDLVVEYIDPGLEGLLDRFFELSRKDLDVIRAAVEQRDFTTLVRLGHTVKGTGYGYGFTGMGKLGGDIEQAALDEDLVALQDCMGRMDRYLSTVRIEFTDKES